MSSSDEVKMTISSLAAVNYIFMSLKKVKSLLSKDVMSLVLISEEEDRDFFGNLLG